MGKFVLGNDARALAQELSDLLNGTVCNGIRITSVITQPGRAQLGYGIDRQDPIAKGITLTLGRKPASGYINFAIRPMADHESTYLAVEASVMGLLSEDNADTALFHYDYERNKDRRYPEAHRQVCAEPHHWPDLCERTRGDQRSFDRLHLPVGGRRYRPALEDLIEFLITENIAESRDDAQKVIDSSRDRFMEKQLRAAIRRRPEVAVDVLRKHAPELLT